MFLHFSLPRSNPRVGYSSLGVSLLLASMSSSAFPFSFMGHQPAWKNLSLPMPLLAYVGYVRTISSEFHLIYNLLMLSLNASNMLFSNSIFPNFTTHPSQPSDLFITHFVHLLFSG